MTKEELQKIEWLNEYKYICRRIDRMEEEIETLRTRLEGMGAQLIDGMPHNNGSGKNNWDKLIFEISKLDNELTSELLRQRQKRLDILEAVNSIKDPRYQVVIEKKYIDNKRMEDICHEMHISWNTVNRWRIAGIRTMKIKDGTQSHVIM